MRTFPPILSFFPILPFITIVVPRTAIFVYFFLFLPMPSTADFSIYQPNETVCFFCLFNIDTTYSSYHSYQPLPMPSTARIFNNQSGIFLELFSLTQVTYSCQSVIQFKIEQYFFCLARHPFTIYSGTDPVHWSRTWKFSIAFKTFNFYSNPFATPAARLVRLDSAASKSNAQHGNHIVTTSLWLQQQVDGVLAQHGTQRQPSAPQTSLARLTDAADPRVFHFPSRATLVTPISPVSLVA